MRDIGAKHITGPQAVLCAAVSWWLSGFDLEKLTLHFAKQVPPENFWSRNPITIANALPLFPWERVNKHFWDSAQSIPAVRRMTEQAVRAWRAKSNSYKIAEVKAFVYYSIMKEVGEIVLNSDFIKENAVVINHARRRRTRK
ncbi:MAG: hypothetical protein WC708_00325 [Lentisphaeria bacterium]|jgi:hypothetical protein